MNPRPFQDGLLEFEQPLENQTIYLDPNSREPSHFHLSCRLTQGERRAQVSWFYNDTHRLPLAQFNTSFDGRTAHLTAKGLKSEYSGSYACEIRLPCGSSMAYTQCEITILETANLNDTQPVICVDKPDLPTPPYPGAICGGPQVPKNSSGSRDPKPISGSCHRDARPGMTSLNRLKWVGPRPTPTGPPPDAHSSHPTLRCLEEAGTDFDGEFTSSSDKYSLRQNLPVKDALGQSQRHQSVSTQIKSNAYTTAEQIDLCTMIDVPGFFADDHDEDSDVNDAFKGGLQRRSQDTSRRCCTSTANCRDHRPRPLPRVIFINATPQGEMLYRGCYCHCHRYHCMYAGDREYPVFDEIQHMRRDSFSKTLKRVNKQISFNPDPELCYEEEADNEEAGSFCRLATSHIPERRLLGLNKMVDQQSSESFRQPRNSPKSQPSPSSYTTTHATSVPQPNRPPDASWRSGPKDHLPQDNEIQSPEAAAAAKEAVKRILEARYGDPKRHDPPPPIRKVKLTVMQTQPTTQSIATTVNKHPNAQKSSDLTQVTTLQEAAETEDTSTCNNLERAAKERFMNALARFQSNVGGNSDTDKDGKSRPENQQECSAEVATASTEPDLKYRSSWRTKSNVNVHPTSNSSAASTQMMKPTFNRRDSVNPVHQGPSRFHLPDEQQCCTQDLTINENQSGRSMYHRNSISEQDSSQLDETADAGPDVHSICQPAKSPPFVGRTSNTVLRQRDVSSVRQEVSDEGQSRWPSNTTQWQPRRSKIFRNISHGRSPSASKRFSMREGSESGDVISYPDADEITDVSLKFPTAVITGGGDSTIITVQCSDGLVFFRKYTNTPLNLLEMKNVVLQFVQMNTHEYLKYGVKVTNFSTSWTDGTAICALVHHFFPNSFDFQAVLSGNKVDNYRLAMQTAAEVANVPNLVDAEELSRNGVAPDWRKIFLYLSGFLVTLEGHPLNRAKLSTLIRTSPR
ncbi:unnamed protein product [Mesocestoides corti]|uniref:Ig-like domain-containing protein n=2 Tax=Mesocestoides corti TaxID=53468 RepID=A0A3P6HLE0_MESCO|nr:unnamed protein product [Mesocestoides corti]